MKIQFGKYKDSNMDDIPAGYFDWLRGQPWINNWPEVVKYIKDNESSINQELGGKNGKL